MFTSDTHKFKSGLTYDEADALVEQYIGGIEDPQVAIAVLKTHLKTSVRDSKMMREVISSLVGGQKRKQYYA